MSLDIASIIPWILAALAGALALFSHRGKKKADAAKNEAEIKAANARVNAQMKEEALQEVQQANTERQKIDAAVAKLPSDNLDDELRKEGLVK